MSADGDLMTVLRVVASLVAVFALVVLAARFARRAGVSGEGAGLRVVDRIGITRETAVAVVEVAGRGLVIGTGTHGVTLLAELDPAELESARRVRRREPGRRVTVTRVVAPQASEAPRPAPTAPAAPVVPAPRTAGTPRTAAAPRTAADARTPAARPGTGAVLDPRTWRQTVDALRELTVRRG